MRRMHGRDRKVHRAFLVLSDGSSIMDRQRMLDKDGSSQ